MKAEPSVEGVQLDRESCNRVQQRCLEGTGRAAIVCNNGVLRGSKAHSGSQARLSLHYLWGQFLKAVALRAGADRLCEVVQVDIVEAEQVVAGEAPDGGHLHMVGKRPSRNTERLASCSRRSMLVLSIRSIPRLSGKESS